MGMPESSHLKSSIWRTEYMICMNPYDLQMELYGFIR